ncbi:l-ascorbate oxidase like [Fagus crenata]
MVALFLADSMEKSVLLHVFVGVVALLGISLVTADDPYRYYTWTVTYGTLSPLGVPQQVILINGQFPGPRLDVVTNNNIILNLINKLDQPFLITWNGIKQRKNSWQDGVLGTNCPIPPNSNYTYKFQAKDQIGTFTYFPSTLLHKAAGGFGGLNVYERPQIPIPFPNPDGDFTLLVGDWFKTNHKTLQQSLDSGKSLPFPDGVLINGQAQNTFSGDQGKTYMFRISNVGLSTSLNFRIQGHTLKLVEVEGSHTIQNIYDSLDVHVGQSVAVLVTLNQPPKDYYIVASTRFTRRVLTASAVLHYSNSHTTVSGPLPAGPTYQIHWSMQQARTFRWNLTASAARPNPQGSYHYGKIPLTKTIVLANSALLINGKQRYAVNSVSYINSDTPLKLADYFNIPGIFNVDSIQTLPSNGSTYLATSVIPSSLHDFIEVVFQNNENAIQSWHLDGYDFWVVGYGSGLWTPAKRGTYNLDDALTRHTAQVYPKSWTTILVSLDNQGMWNLRSAIWERQYLGQQLYLRVWTAVHSLANEYNIPSNALLCGKAVGQHP